MGKQTRRKIHAQRGWDYLRRLDFSLLIPRPRHHKSNKEQQEAFKQALPEEVQHLQQIYPHAKIGLWCMDEHRIGLKPGVRRIWARHPGIAQSLASNNGMNGSLYTDLPIPNQERAIGCYCPRSGSRFSPLLWSILHRLLVPAQIGASSWCADRAGWHSSQMLVIPDGIHLVFLPPYSPELQRMSSASGHSRAEAIAHRRFETLDELQEAQAERCVALQNDATGIRHATLFHWWPTSFL